MTWSVSGCLCRRRFHRAAFELLLLPSAARPPCDAFLVLTTPERLFPPPSLFPLGKLPCRQRRLTSTALLLKFSR